MFITNDPIIVGIISISIFALLTLPFFIFRKRKNYSIIMSLYVLCVVYVMRLSVTLVGDPEGTETLNFGERVFDSFVHALQSFSMDEGYTEYTKVGKAILNDYGYSSWAFVYGIFISILNVLAPVIGGALLLDILTGVFPSLRLALHPFKHKYVFSELNEMSIVLAEDICSNKNYKLINPSCKTSPLIVFTDSYVDDESEISSELYARAKKLNAICVKSDLLELRFTHSKMLTYLLIDKSTEENISSFSKLIRNRKIYKNIIKRFFKPIDSKYLFPISTKDKEPKTQIFVFVQEEYESDRIYSILNASDTKEQVLVRTIRDYMNAAINLMVKAPLFLPLLYRTADVNNLNITILGSGSIATEVFKTVYWCSQMNKNIDVNVTVVSTNASSMENKLNEFYSEMMECCKPDSYKLRVYDRNDSPFNPPYLKSIGFVDVDDVFITSSYKSIIEKTDYFIIALGSDSVNHKMTSIINREMSLHKIERQSQISTVQYKESVVIVPAIFDTELADSIREVKISSKDGKPTLDTFIVPFATFKERFSCQNVFFSSFIDDALSTHELYAKRQAGKCANDEYSWLADIVREIHVPYKLFGVGKLRPSVDESSLPYQYERNNGEMECSTEMYHVMSWIEHRRWNAFLRSQGFSCPKDWTVFDAYCNSDYNNHKNISLKLHPCLVESVCYDQPCSVKPLDLKLLKEKLNGSDAFALDDLNSIYASDDYDLLDYASARIFFTRYKNDMIKGISEEKRFNLPSVLGYKDYDYYGYYDDNGVWQKADPRLNKLMRPYSRNME